MDSESTENAIEDEELTEGDDKGNEEKEVASGSMEKLEDITKTTENTNDEKETPEVETACEEKTSEDTNDTSEATKKEDANEESKNTDNVADVEKSRENEEGGLSVDKEVDVGTQDGKEGSSDDKEGVLERQKADDGTGVEGTPDDKEGNVEDSEGLTKSGDGDIEGTKGENEAVNVDKGGHLGDSGNSNGRDDGGTTESTTENEAAETGHNESEVNKSRENKSKEGEVVESGTRDDDGSEGVSVDKMDSEITTEEKPDDQTNNDNKDNDETAIESVAQDNSENLSDKEERKDETSAVIETNEISTEKDQSGTNEENHEIVVDPVASLESNREGHSNPDDSKSEVPSEDTDDLVNEILTVTDDVDAGKKSEHEAVVVVASDSSEKVKSDSRKSEDGEPVVSGESSEKPQDDDQPSDSSEKDGFRSSEGQETELQSNGHDAQASDAHLDVETNEKAEEESQRSGSSHTAYRVQAGEYKPEACRTRRGGRGGVTSLSPTFANIVVKIEFMSYGTCR